MTTEVGTEIKLSARKPWIKCRGLQDIIARYLGFSHEHIADIAWEELTDEDWREILLHDIGHFYPIVESSVENANPIIRRKKMQERIHKREEMEKQVEKEVDENIRRIAANILNMTGAVVRAVHAIPTRYFSEVDDNQKVGDVLSIEEVIDLLTRYRPKSSP